ncbi:MAG TPA: hypothetical protein VLH79_06010 [Chthonomonadales bacterium]|nr:hypothetical protein [Chthonomonadales bacterium]
MGILWPTRDGQGTPAPEGMRLVRLLYRADGGHPIGTGHLCRAVRILTALSEHGPLDAVLLTSRDEGALRIAQEAPARVEMLPRGTRPCGVKPRLTAAPVLEAAARHRPDVIVVDMLDTPGEAMAALAGHGRPLVTFDDRGGGRVHADLLVNVLVVDPAPQRLSHQTRLLEGPPYAVLDRVFAAARQSMPEREFGPVESVCVAMGGADAAGLTVKVARALRGVAHLRRVQFCCGTAFPHRAALDAVLVDAPWVYEVYAGLPNLLDRYVAADVAMVAGGLTMYETCVTGTPAIAVCQPIDHQFELAARLADAGCMLTVGYGLDASEASIRGALAALAADPERRRAMSNAGRALVDGNGTERVASAIAGCALAR